MLARPFCSGMHLPSQSDVGVIGHFLRLSAPPTLLLWQRTITSSSELNLISAATGPKVSSSEINWICQLISLANKQTHAVLGRVGENCRREKAITLDVPVLGDHLGALLDGVVNVFDALGDGALVDQRAEGAVIVSTGRIRCRSRLTRPHRVHRLQRNRQRLLQVFRQTCHARIRWIMSAFTLQILGH